METPLSGTLNTLSGIGSGIDNALQSGAKSIMGGIAGIGSSFLGQPNQQSVPGYVPPPNNGSVSVGGASGYDTQPAQPKITPTSTGGLSFPSSLASGYSQTPPAPTSPQNTTSSQSGGVTTKPDLMGFGTNTNTVQTPNGGTLTMQGGAGGTPTGFTPASGYSIDTSGSSPSSTLSQNTSPQDVQNQQKSLQDYVNAVAQAQGYSPQYIQALNQQYQAQGQGAQLGLNTTNINANLATGNGFAGYTSGEAGSATNIEQALNNQQLGVNAVQQLSANQALNTQQLARTGAIAGAQTQLQYSPASVNAQNAQAQYNALQQQYGGVQTPPFNPSQDPQAQLQNIHQLIANSPAYQSQFTHQYGTPGGGTGLVNMLNTGALTQNSDGTIQLVSGAANALGSANASAVGQLTQQYNSMIVPYTAANSDFTAMNKFMQSSGLNDASIPLINQIENKVKSGLLQPGAVAGFNAYIQSLRTNYASLLAARSGSVVGVNEEAAKLVPDDLDVNDMQTVQQALNTNGQNVINETQTQLQKSLSGLSGGTSSSQIGTGNTPSFNSWADVK